MAPTFALLVTVALTVYAFCVHDSRLIIICVVGGAALIVGASERARFYRSIATAEGAPKRRVGLHVPGPFNSQKFTNCCGLAVHGERVCPGCKAPIFR